MPTSYFKYDKFHLDYLKSKDKKLTQVIDYVGFVEREIDANLFVSLVNSIVGQQISRKAHITIFNKVKELLGEIDVENILKIDAQKMQSCGLSSRKVEYIKGIASEIKSGNFDIESLANMSDDEVCQKLSSLKGVGKWTAQMLMIFSMNRLNIIAYDDLGIQKGLRMIYHHRKITKQLFEKYKKRYHPYASVASLYIWEVGNGNIEGYKDYAPLKAKVK